MSLCCDPLLDLLDPRLFKALSDPNRITMFCQLADCCGGMTVSEMAERFPIDISVVSRHLALLRDAGLLKSTRDGKQVRYWLMVSDVVDRLRKIADALETCCLAAKTSACSPLEERP
ncbi:MAG: winged helix-turn-helix transcriptional regulator [Myxococcales bacterium]|nr:winged helix-turn-helix transcriptional regulator [Myxococcales bacterium]